MFPSDLNQSATLPRGFRLRCPTTPEPAGAEEMRQPSPPRHRLKVRRRIASSFAAPTESFLASVAAADTPLPSIEIADVEQDQEMADFRPPPLITTGLLEPFPSRLPWRSPPRTPEPSVLKLDEQIQRPDWYKSITPDLDARPISSHSYVSDSDNDSCFGSLTSRPSDDGSCTSPDSDVTDPFGPPSFSKASAQRVLPLSFDPQFSVESSFEPVPETKTTKPVWTKEMNSHLWSTYMLYLQDPRVTPFNIGVSGVPPDGICRRVAREAKRSWKGGRNQKSSAASSKDIMRSGSVTPTLEETVRVYTAWPHSGVATRTHLRELCKYRTTSIVSTHRHFQSRPISPLADGQTSYRARRRCRTPRAQSLTTPEPQASFTKELGLSLATSTSESMKPDGPLAKLAAGLDVPTSDTPQKETSPWGERTIRGLSSRFGGRTHARQLSAPFSSQTYGPSSSNIFGNTQSPFDPLELRKQPDTIATSRPRLGSPVRFEPRSQNNTQKRRAKFPLEEELSPSGANLRPSILDDKLFGPPLDAQPRRIRRPRGFTMGDEGFMARERETHGDLASFAVSRLNPFSDGLPTSKTSPSMFPPRLGSPFTESGANNTFPRRVSGQVSESSSQGGRGSGPSFVTMRPHHMHRSAESLDSTTRDMPSTDLQSRLKSVEQRLQEIANMSSKRDI